MFGRRGARRSNNIRGQKSNLQTLFEDYGEEVMINQSIKSYVLDWLMDCSNSEIRRLLEGCDDAVISILETYRGDIESSFHNDAGYAIKSLEEK